MKMRFVIPSAYMSSSSLLRLNSAISFCRPKNFTKILSEPAQTETPVSEMAVSDPVALGYNSQSHYGLPPIMFFSQISGKE
jgi:hypothetical protein